ncbi:hypothetical protein [Sphingobium ummariense]|uniref:Uncharacterized protein n=1 Tax=Sphingobium ummariense RL-3 TaxID=1346791 RepID=T0J6C3_9SPHN|nr:hypothetical protein [Sphingobium ummariense]EQB33531.1 hypothetical protein M529_03750 [Sphingobium ummariense RL-3]
MLDPNPSVADLDALLDRHADDDAAMENVVRGFLRCAIYSYQKHCVRRALRHIGKNEWSFREEDVAAFRAEGAQYVSDFRDWIIEELAGFGIKAGPQLPN